MKIPIQDNCLNCIHKDVCYKSAWQQEPCNNKIEDRIRGEWKEKWIDGAAIYAIVHCSNCGHYGNPNYSFCPYCGSIMKGE